MKKVLQFIAFGILGVAVFLLLIAGATQTQFFRDRLRSIALHELNSVFSARVTMGPITGNLVSGFSIDSVSFLVHEHTLIAVQRIDLRYNLFEVPGRKITVSNLTLVRPEMRLVRGTDSSWNYNHLLLPAPTDSAAQPFTWPILVDHLEIQNGLLTVADSLVMCETPPRSAVSRRLHDFTIRDINMVLSARIQPGEKFVHIDRLTAASDSQHLTLERLSGEFSVTPTEASVKNLVIGTHRSSIALSASLRKCNLFGGIRLPALEHCPAAVSLEGAPVDLNELQQLLPELSFLDGQTGINLNATGEFGRLNVHRLDLETGGTFMRWRGTIANLHRPANLKLSVKLYESTIDPGGVARLMPPFDLPDFSHLGPVSLLLDFDGLPLDFKAKLDLRTSAGDVRSDFALKIGGKETLRYRATVHGEGVNLSTVFSMPALESSLNGTASITGEGIAFENLASTFILDLDRSVFRGLSVPPSHMQLDASRRVVTFDGTLGLGGMTSKLTASLDKTDRTAPKFTILGNVDALNLATILHDNYFDSDLTLRLQVTGHGLTWASLGGDALFDLSSSRYREYRVSSGEMHVSLDQSNPLNKRLEVKSNIADISLQGTYNLASLVRVLLFEEQNLRLAVGEKLASVDSSFLPTIEPARFAAMKKTAALTTGDSLKAVYSIRIKDLEPVSVVAGRTHFQGTGTVTGKLAGGYNDLSMSANLDAKYFFYGNVDKGTLLQNASMGFTLSHLKPVNPLHDVQYGMSATAEKMIVNHVTLDGVAVRVRYDHEAATYDLRAGSEASSLVAVRGTAAVTDSGVSARLDSLVAGYKSFLWEASPGTRLSITSSEAGIRGLELHRDSSAVTIDAKLGTGNTLDAHVTGSQLNLRDLRFLAASDGPRQEQSIQGSVDIEAHIAGDVTSPVLTASVHGRDVAFKGHPFGQVIAELSYRDTMLQGSIVGGIFTGPNSAAPLHINGKIPLNLIFGAVDSRLPELPMHLEVTSTGSQLSILGPLIPSFSDLSGIMRCYLTVNGTPREPQYSGDILVEGCRFLFVPNSIQYALSASLTAQGDRIVVNKAIVQNVPEDNRNGKIGEAEITGDFALREFRPCDFNLFGKGKLLVIKENSRLSSLSLYGNLFAEMSDPGLHFTGNIEASSLKGAVNVTNSNLVFPPTQTSMREESLLSIPITFVDDTTHARPMELQEETASFFNRDTTNARVRRTEEGEESAKSFLDGVQYDLDIDVAGGDSQIRMVFNAITKEELVASIQGRFNVLGDGRQWFGDLEISRAYYNFIKRFNAEGTIRYRGNVLNPELDIRATYQSQRLSPDSSSRGLTEIIVVTFSITGTRFEPKIAFAMTINGEDYYQYQTRTGVVTSHDVQTDAIQFIVYGSFPLTAAQKGDAGSDIRAALGGSLVSGATSMLTGAFSDFLQQQTGFINSVDFSYDAKSSLRESADLRLSGVAWNGLWRYGGKILDNPFSNANFSILYSLGAILNKPSLRNFMFELERKVETNPLSLTNELKATDSARLFYRFSF